MATGVGCGLVPMLRPACGVGIDLEGQQEDLEQGPLEKEGRSAPLAPHRSLLTLLPLRTVLLPGVLAAMLLATVPLFLPGPPLF